MRFLTFSGGHPRFKSCRIANGVISNRCTVVFSELVFPVAVTVGVGNRLEGGAHSAGGVGVAGLAQDVAAPVVGVDPGGARRAAGGIVLVVHPDQLAQIVVGVRIYPAFFTAIPHKWAARLTHVFSGLILSQSDQRSTATSSSIRLYQPEELLRHPTVLIVRYCLDKTSQSRLIPSCTQTQGIPYFSAYAAIFG